MDDAMYVGIATGLRVVTSFGMVVSSRIHKKPDKMSAKGRIYRLPYSNRIQNKWDKRFGVKPRNDVVVVREGGYLVIHPETLSSPQGFEQKILFWSAASGVSS